ncbi:MAG: hypothetical protein C4520_12800 [Candidatus Abyssobacteria bacterium SURF_5]|uniref:Cytochrome c7-like domain-containing protein n=1 Tax=Abyssobacteria bacterium (strain SURF_5) TaxID=2093360 RepID=A0A3A4NLR8_ABYX5|nr:MAG: hypothetical protein C4520_12800 [Candidatus Abyssubacteria bacterium SURF_5]
MIIKKTSLLAIVLLILCPVVLTSACSGGGGGGGGGGGDTGHVLDQEADFLVSGHADAMAEAFVHWDEEDPPEVPVTCAKCHNTAGFQDFLGVDGSTVRVVDFAVAIDPAANNAFTCDLCHNSEIDHWNSVIFPSGAEVTGLQREAFCMECHQGRESTVSVDAAIAAAAPPDDDTVSASLSFKNVHYFPAAATLYGGTAMGAYQYTGKSYDVKFAHVEGFDTCIDCHNPHSLEVEVQSCQPCHTGAATAADLVNIRMLGSTRDYDGDGNITEGMAREIETLQSMLYAAIQAYASEVAGADIIYDPNAYPYFFGDTNGNGVVDEGEAKYASWTARLVRAAYNHHYVVKDPGSYAHNGKYIVELLYDSIEDINSALAPASQIDLSSAHRIDAGHFAGSEEAFRHWDGDGEVSSSCSRCHSATGLAEYLETGTVATQALANGFLCSTCHDAIPNFSSQRLAVQVTFPSGEVIDSGDNTTNLCMQCHQGRESKVSVDAKTTGKPEDTIDATLSFVNVHYFAAGATRYGTEALGGYEYDGMSYDGYFPHVAAYSACNDCHDTHALEPKVEVCGQCHAGVVDPADMFNIRMAGSTVDYNGNGNVTEGISSEIEGLRTLLYAAIQAYPATVPGANPIAYDGSSYPYFFDDLNGNGVADAGEGKYTTWTPRLLKAAYNMQYTLKDPGCSAHNAKYVIELLYDGINSLDPTVAAGLTRNDEGHFNAASEAFRHWDGDGEVSASCTRCHAPAAGFDYYIQNGVDSPAALPVSYGLTCETCHTGTDFAGSAPRKFVPSVTFKSGVTITNNPATPDDSFLCIVCHQGRESKSTIDAAIGAGSFSFKNVHYLPAGAIQYGSDAIIGYQYDGKSYVEMFDHFSPNSAQCNFCHELAPEKHTFHVVLTTECTGCHGPVATVEDIRTLRATDYDGDTNNTERLIDEIATLGNALYAEIQTYAATTLGSPIVYDEHAHPYFFIDTNGNGVRDAGEDSKYTAWDGALMKAAHNFQIWVKEPGAWAHNTNYIAQLLIDSIEDLGGDVSSFKRP